MTLKKIKFFEEIGKAPKTIMEPIVTKDISFIEKEIFIKEIDYYYTNAIARSSKTMSECREASNKSNLIVKNE